MAEPIKDMLVTMGRRVRVYTPYGQLLPGMAYLVRRLLENTANESFLRASFKENVPEEQLLMDPHAQSSVDSLPALATSANGRLARDGELEARGPFRNEPLTEFGQQTRREAVQ